MHSLCCTPHARSRCTGYRPILDAFKTFAKTDPKAYTEEAIAAAKGIAYTNGSSATNGSHTNGSATNGSATNGSVCPSSGLPCDCKANGGGCGAGGCGAGGCGAKGCGAGKDAAPVRPTAEPIFPPELKSRKMGSLCIPGEVRVGVREQGKCAQ